MIFITIANILEININTLNIIIKPHHLLDIFKLYGKGIEKFIPDEKYNHNFYSIANSVIENKISKIQFTYGFDDICKPCDFLKDTVCIDEFKYDGIVYKKNSYNEKLDIRLIRALDLKIDKIYEFSYIINILNDKLNLELINLVWYSCNLDDNKLRYNYTKKGIEKYVLEHC